MAAVNLTTSLLDQSTSARLDPLIKGEEAKRCMVLDGNDTASRANLKCVASSLLHNNDAQMLPVLWGPQP